MLKDASVQVRWHSCEHSCVEMKAKSCSRIKRINFKIASQNPAKTFASLKRNKMCPERARAESDL